MDKKWKKILAATYLAIILGGVALFSSVAPLAEANNNTVRFDGSWVSVNTANNSRRANAQGTRLSGNAGVTVFTRLMRNFNGHSSQQGSTASAFSQTTAIARTTEILPGFGGTWWAEGWVHVGQ